MMLCRIVQQHPSNQDLTLSLVEITDPRQGDRIRWILGNESREDDANKDGEDPFDLYIVRRWQVR